MAAGLGDAELDLAAGAASLVTLAVGARHLMCPARRRPALVAGHPARDGLRHRDKFHDLRTITEGVLPGTATEQHVGIVPGMDVQNGHGPRGMAVRNGLGAGNSGNAAKEICRLAGQPVAHHGAIGHAGRENACRVDAQSCLHVGDDSAYEADIVDAPVTRFAAAAAGIPGGQPAAGETAVAVRTRR